MVASRVRLVCALSLLVLSWNASAVSEYNDPGNNKLYAQCLRDANKRYRGGEELSPVRGQTKLQAWCSCMWNETPDDFTGSLVRFAETDRGKRTNKICEAYSDWHD